MTLHRLLLFFFFFFNDTATTEIYTLSLHDALPICVRRHVTRQLHMAGGSGRRVGGTGPRVLEEVRAVGAPQELGRSEEHTSELQSRLHLVCRLLLEKKKQNICLYDYFSHGDSLRVR